MILRFTSLCGRQHACNHDPYFGTHEYPGEKACPENKSLLCSQKVFFKLFVLIIGKIQRGLNGSSRNPKAMKLWSARKSAPFGKAFSNHSHLQEVFALMRPRRRHRPAMTANGCCRPTRIYPPIRWHSSTSSSGRWSGSFGT